MIVVADSSPLHYLMLIEQAEVLRRLHGEKHLWAVAGK